MRFYFDIDESEFDDECSIDFKQTVINRAIESVAEWIYNSEANIEHYGSVVRDQVNDLIKSRQQDIVDSVVEKVSDKIAKKKEIVAITPKASELTAADKENIAYFEQMIDKAIARRFGKR